MAFGSTKIKYKWMFELVDGDGSTYKSKQKNKLRELMALLPANSQDIPLVSLVRIRPPCVDDDEETCYTDNWYPDVSKFSDYDDPPAKFVEEWELWIAEKE